MGVSTEMIKKLLSSMFVWKLTGISYVTAVIATSGKYMPPSEYVVSGRTNVIDFAEDLRNKRVLELGCGLGRNLFALSNVIKEGVGIDINRGYVRIATKLAKKYGFHNVSCISYDGQNLPELGKFDAIMEIGVFERLPKAYVKELLLKLREAYAIDGTQFILYFLTSRAKGTEFTKRLGDEAYIYWDDGEVRDILSSLGIEIERVLQWKYANVYIGSLRRKAPVQPEKS